MTQVLDGATLDERFGAVVLYAGDRNGDGFPEVLVGSPDAAREGGLHGGPPRSVRAGR